MTRSTYTNLAFAWALLLTGTACTSEPPADQVPAAPVTIGSSSVGATLEAATDLGVSNARMPLPNLVTAGQPTQEQMLGLAEAGFGHFISLREADERGAGWEEVYTADQPFDFDRLPIAGSDALTRENVETLAALLDAADGEPTVLYCGSSNRVGALLALKAYWVDGLDAEAAFELGERAGMKSLKGQVRGLLGLD